MAGMTAAVSGTTRTQGKTSAERCPAVVLQVEMRNFTRLSEMLEPDRVLQLAGAFFSLAGAAVKANGGEVFPVQNDALVAAFRGANPAQLASRAIQAAQAQLRDFGPLGERWNSDYGLPATIAVGLHLGETIFGMAGPQGAEQYVAFGDPVSIAERLLHRARAGEIVFSAPVAKALGEGASGLGAQPLPPLDLGRRPALPIFGILLETRLDFT